MALSLSACGGSDDVAVVTTPVEAKTFALTIGQDAKLDFTGTALGDIFNAKDDTNDNAGTVNSNSTLTATDSIDGAGGNDVLNVEEVGAISLPAVTVANIETVNLTSGGAVTADMTTGWTGVEALNVTAAGALDIDVLTTVDVVAVTSAGAIVIDGGKNITVTDAVAANNTTIGVTTENAGDVIVTDTNLTTGLILVDSGADVDVSVSKTSIAGSNNYDVSGNGTADSKAAVIVGATSFDGTSGITGDVTVTSSGAAITATSATATLGMIGVGAAGNVTVTQSATSDASAAAADTASVATITQGAVYVSTGADGTSVSISQDANATANDAVAAVAAKAATQTVTFTAAKATDTVTVTFDTNDSITFTAAKDLTAEEVASAFANLAKNATEGSAAATLGTYTNGSGTIAEGWTSGVVVAGADTTTASVTFSNAATNTLSVGVGSGDTVTATAATATAATAAVLAETGKLGVVAGKVVVDGAITGADVLKSVSIDAYESASTVTTDALETLTLSNSDEDVTVHSASTGSVTLNLNKVAGADAAVNFDGTAATITAVDINATGTKSDVVVTANKATSVDINADVDLDLTGSSFDVATSMTVAGAGKVTLDGDDSTSTVVSIDTTSATGTVDASGVAMTAAGIYSGGAGADTFTVTASATKASSGGAGDDVITVSSFGTGGSVDAGEGTDKLSMTVANAASVDGNMDFSTKATNFEELALSGSNLAATTLDMANLGLTSAVTTAGVGAVVTSAASAWAANDTLSFVYNGTTYTATYATGTTDENINAVIDAAVDAGSNALGANKVTAVGSDSAKTITLTADSDQATLSAGSWVDDSGSATTAGADQALTLANLASGATVSLTAYGAVVAQVKDAATGPDDVLNIAMSTDGALDAGALTAANVETINITATDKVVDVTGAKDAFGANVADGTDDTNATHTLDLTADKAKTIKIDGSADVVLDMVSSTAVTSVNAGDLTGKLTITLDGKSTGTTITAGSGDDTIVASGAGDVIVGGAGKDTITLTNTTTATGGEGADTFVFATAAATTSYSTITDLEAGDTIQLLDGSSGNSFTTTAITGTAQTTFAELVDLAAAETTSGTNVTDAAWFQYGGNTYIVQEAAGANGATYVASTDIIVEIEGLYDLSTAVFNETTSTLEIV